MKIDLTFEELNVCILQCNDKTEFANKLGFTYYNGKVSKIITKLIEENNLNFDHFDVSAKLKAKRKYPKIKKNCPVCLNEFEILKGSPKEKQTCSYSCSNTYFASIRHNEESKEKVSISLKHYHGDINREQICKTCNESFINSNNLIHCSRICAMKDPDVRKKISDKMQNRIANGIHKGWASRSKLKPSYPEQIVINLLKDLCIECDREYKCGKWFIDFADVNRKLALEIDGKQHELPERKSRDERKDQYLIDNGWKILRIKWKRISKEFREELLNKINDFFKIIIYV